MLLKSYIRELYDSIYRIQKRVKDKFDTRRSKIEVLMVHWDNVFKEFLHQCIKVKDKEMRKIIDKIH